jgi:hypothetical protein
MLRLLFESGLDEICAAPGMLSNSARPVRSPGGTRLWPIDGKGHEVLSLPKTPFPRLALSSESEHDRRMIAIASLFVGVLCDCFKPRQRLEAEILVLWHQLNILQHRAPRRLHLRMIGQKGEGLDRFRPRQQARGARPRISPGLAGVRPYRRDFLNRTFRHVAFDPREAIEMLLANSVGERVDEAGDIRLRFCDERRDRLIADIEAGQIDVVIVYKGRPADLRPLRFCQARRGLRPPRVSFVSITQQFNRLQSFTQSTWGHAFNSATGHEHQQTVLPARCGKIVAYLRSI